jgi:hypothetical protein
MCTSSLQSRANLHSKYLPGVFCCLYAATNSVQLELLCYLLLCPASAYGYDEHCLCHSGRRYQIGMQVPGFTSTAIVAHLVLHSEFRRLHSIFLALIY